ncbi:WG containing repeat-containing protein [Chryseobacterium taichungense]|uniref:WG containing repeat-containing protein n=1 Tax=Chryseobacterium taichungense TaxID=295069 RepID=A0A1H8B2T6_9FLAO|nr:WG repeat-containing protein [Chryseobacterium taichungense]SEM77255.1 WG containing repeat-containing protein [Chryseobacterium taichungense]
MNFIISIFQRIFADNMGIKNIIQVLSLLISVAVFSQKSTPKKAPVKKKVIVAKENTVLPVINEDLPLLIPKKKDGNFGYVDQKGRFVIKPEYHIAVFFYEDCNLLNAPDEKLRKFGTADYATVEKDEISYRVDKKGKRVYRFRQEDLGKCVHKEYTQQLYQAYVLNGFYGIIEKATFKDPADYRQFQIYPQYDYLFILEGDDVANPMIIASKNNMFGVIDVHNRIIIPFEYDDIKRNFSWKLGKMFDVSKDGKNYYYIDSKNRTY